MNFDLEEKIRPWVQSYTAVLVGGGPSVFRHLETLEREKVLDNADILGCNLSYREIPSDIHFCINERMSKILHEAGIYPVIGQTFCEYAAYKVPIIGRYGWGFNLATGLYSGHTVGYFALQVASILGYRKIYMAGFDCGAVDGKHHAFLHGDSTLAHYKLMFPKWKKSFAIAEEELTRRGVELVRLV